MNMLPSKNVTNPENMPDRGNYPMFSPSPNDVYQRRDFQGSQQPMNMQRVIPSRPPRVESAPTPANHGMGFQGFGGNPQPMMGMSPANINPIDGSYYPSGGLFPMRVPPKALSPNAMSNPNMAFIPDRAKDGMLQSLNRQYTNHGQDVYYDIKEQQEQIDEVESNSLDSQDNDQNVPSHFTGPRGNMIANMKNVRDIINDDEYQTESRSRGNRSGHDSEKYHQQKSKPVQSSIYMRNPQPPVRQAYPSNTIGYQSEYYPEETYDQNEDYQPPERQDHNQPQDYEEEQSLEEEDDFTQNGHPNQVYLDRGRDPQASKTPRTVQKIPRESDYLPTQKLKQKQKPKDRKRTTKPSQSQVETYEPQGARYSPQGGHKAKGQGLHSGINLHDWNKQQGSRAIQHYLETESKDTINLIIRDLIPNLVDISLNIFGNYVAQKMIEVGRVRLLAPSASMKLILAEVARHMETFCFSNFGCRVVLKLYDIMAFNDESQIQFFADSYIERNVQRMMVDQNANYIIQKIIFLQHHSKIDFITDLFTKDVGFLVQPDYQTMRESICLPCFAATRTQSKRRQGRKGWHSVKQFMLNWERSSLSCHFASSVTT